MHQVVTGKVNRNFYSPYMTWYILCAGIIS